MTTRSPLSNRHVCGWAAALMLLPMMSIAQPDGEPVTIAHRYQIESKALGEKRSYVVHKPWNYEISNEEYPVLVLLDAENNINQVAAVADFLSNTGRAMRMLVVGVENTDRQRDLTPPLVNEKPSFVPEGPLGGAPKFLSFIADELLPHIDRNYRTRPTRILVGFSYSGLFTLYALFNRPEVFKAYIAVSPALWWDDQSLAMQAEEFVAAHKDLRAALYMTIANEDGPMLAGAHRVMSALRTVPNAVSAEFHRWPHESHSSVNMPSVYEGLEWLYDFYYTHDPVRAYEESGLVSFERRFALISQYLGYEVKVPQTVFMTIRGYLTESKRWDEARVVAQKQVDLYPDSAGAHFDLASICTELADAQCATAHVKRSLEMFPGNKHAGVVLDKVGIKLDSLVNQARPSGSVLRKHVGQYRTPEGELSITLDDGKLYARLRHDRRELRAMSDREFYAVDSDREYTFKSDVRGATTSVIVKFPEVSIESPRSR